MLRKFFKDKGIKLTDMEFQEILQITTDDIRENRVKFGKRTSLGQMFTIALMTYCVIKKVA